MRPRGVFQVVGVLVVALVVLLAGLARMGDGNGPPRSAWAASSCGNAIIEPPEQCDPPGSITCPPSPAAAFLPCNPDCTCPTVPPTTTTTATASTTSTTTPPSGPDHYVCYNSGTNEPNPPDVTLTDQFETAQFHPKRCHPKSFCTPASKNGSQITDPVTHLKAYKIARLTGSNPHVTVDVTNQFGTIRLTTKKATRLLVPSAKSLTAPPPPLDPLLAGNQHYKCYSISAQSFAPVTVTAVDQFGTRQLLLTKPVSLCNPVSKNGSDIKDPARHLLCYSVRPATRPSSPVFATNQFGSQTLKLAGEGAFCVPSTKSVVEPPTTTSTTLPPCAGTPFPVCGGACAAGQVCQALASLDHGTVVSAVCGCVDEGAVCGPDPVVVCTAGPCPPGSACVSQLTNTGFACGCGAGFTTTTTTTLPSQCGSIGGGACGGPCPNPGELCVSSPFGGCSCFNCTANPPFTCRCLGDTGCSFDPPGGCPSGYYCALESVDPLATQCADGLCPTGTCPPGGVCSLSGF